MCNESLVYEVALSSIFLYRVKVPRVLIETFGTAKEIFNLSRDELIQLFGKSSIYINKLLSSEELDRASMEIEWCHSTGIEIYSYSSPQFPKQLNNCVDTPILFYSLGKCDFNSSKIIAIVGTREPSVRGVEECRMIVRELAASGTNPIVVSGLAYGIDITAHESALENGLETIAVLANPLTKIYPKAHRAQAKRVIKQGALITEFPRNSNHLKLNFVQRNRLIAALSSATIVVESRERGGALTTAEIADSYSREVFAVPGRVTDSRSQGCNHLIAKNRANIFTTTQELLTQLKWIESVDKKGKKAPLLKNENPTIEKILITLRSHPGMNMDELHIKTGIAISELASLLLNLEIRGEVVQTSGKRFLANNT